MEPLFLKSWISEACEAGRGRTLASLVPYGVSHPQPISCTLISFPRYIPSITALSATDQLRIFWFGIQQTIYYL